jgi:hypothetical protein
MIGKAIYAQLAATAAVTAIISTRIYPQTVPETSRTYPCVAYDGDAAEIDDTYDGSSGLAYQTIKVGCLAASYAGMDALAKVVFDALSDGSGTWGGIKVQGCFFEGDDEPPPNSIQGRGPDYLIYERELTFKLAFNLP